MSSPPHRALIEDIKATGYDGIEVPIFEGEPEHYARLGALLDEIGLERTAISVIPTPDVEPLSEDPEVRRASVRYLNHISDCTAALGASQVAGPLHQVLGRFSGSAHDGGGVRARPRGASRGRRLRAGAGRDARARGGQPLRVATSRTRWTTSPAISIRVDHPAVTGMYDTFHANIEEQDPVAAFTRNQRHLNYVHISENDRGVPGRGHVPWAETFAAIKGSGYDGWLTIEAFGRGLPALAAATRVWRDFAESPEAVYREGYRWIRDGWDAA